MVQVDLTDPNCLTDKLSAIEFADTVNLDTELNGVLNVSLVTAGGGVGGFSVTVITDISKTNLFDEYATALSDADAWVVKKNNAVVTPTGVTYNAITKQFIVALAVTGSDITVSLASPSALALLGIGGNGTSGFESNTVSTGTIA
jgi:hypothetical protein